MTATYEIDREKRRLFTRWEGYVTLAGILQHIERRTAEDTLEFSQLINAANASVAFTSLEAERIADTMKLHAKRIRLGPTAILAKRDLDFGMYRLFATVADEAYAVNVFRSDETARQWLGWVSEAVM